MLLTGTADTSLVEHILSIIACMLVLCLVIIIVAGMLRDRYQKKIKKKTEEYERSVHVKKVTLTDPIFFGTIEAEYDDRTGILKAEQADLPRFGTGKPNRILVEEYQDADRDDILRIMNRAYDRCDAILTKMAEMLLHEIQFDKAENLPEISELKKLITVTDFQFASGEELMTMLINAGAGYDSQGYSVTALYYTNPSHWEYECEKLEGGI